MVRVVELISRVSHVQLFGYSSRTHDQIQSLLVQAVVSALEAPRALDVIPTDRGRRLITRPSSIGLRGNLGFRA